MDEVAFYPTAVLAVLFLVIYIVRCSRNHEDIDIGTIINTVFQAGGIVVGLLLAASTFSQRLQAYLTHTSLYIFIGGLAIAVVSAQGLRKGMFDDGPNTEDKR